MNLEKWGGRGKKELIQIPSVGHLTYGRFKQNIKHNNFIEQTLEALSCDSDDNYYSSSTIHLCRCIAESYEDKFITASSDTSLTFSDQMPGVETTSMMSNAGINIYQFRILLRSLRDKLDTRMFEPEK